MGETAAGGPDAAGVRAVWPLLWVRDLEEAISFWTDGLGFSLVGADGPAGRRDWARLTRGGASVMLQSGASPSHSSAIVLYFVCEDVDALYAELSDRSVPVEPPTTASYGMRQLRVPDPEGHEIWFETPTEAWNG